MERVIFVEVLGRRGEVAQRIRLAALPATIGRGWTNDVILSDPHADAQHARIGLDDQGEIVIEDLGSVNGLRAAARGPRVPRIPVNGLTPVRIGRTWLRVVAGEQAVPPAIAEQEPTGRLDRMLASPRAMLLIALLGIGLTALSTWLADYDDKAFGVLAGSVLALIGGAVIWAGIWAFAGRLIVHRAMFWQHLTLAWLFFLGTSLVSLVESWLTFLFPTPGVIGIVSVALLAALFVGVVTIHAGLASLASRRRRMALGFGLLAGLSVITWVGEKAARNDYDSGSVAVTATMKPLPAGLVPAESLDEFLRSTLDIRKKIDRLE